jgi:photosystem II stability/assembly factor-like uncharacterized protein
VHGLGVNPADGALLVATHTGLYRLAPEAARSDRVSRSHQDTMGFTVVGPDHFLGSGHPDVRDDLPSHLGLVESKDGGRTWKPVSLLGEADFHVLRYASGRLYGYDVAGDRLLVSGDSGRTWDGIDSPGPVIDLAVDPENERRLVATTSEELVRSQDGGRTWERIGEVVGLLAWPTAERLYVIDGAGRVFRSANGGLTLEQAGSVAGEPAAVTAPRAAELFIALHDGTIQASRDGGATWSVRSRPETDGGLE